jgi:glycosyltransferase involved in cell wall biosynthesis
MERRIRILHLVSHPIQYFAPLYRELAKRSEIELSVVFYSDASIHEFVDPGFERRIAWNADLLGGYKSIIPPSAQGRALHTRLLTTPQLDVLRIVAKSDYDVVWAHGYAHATTWLAWFICLLRRKPFLLREEQTLLRSRTHWRRLVKEIPLRALIKSSFGLYIGEENRRYLKRYGSRDDRLFAARYCVDNTLFRQEADELAGRRAAIRVEFGIYDDAPVILFCGKLAPTKNPQLLIRAFGRLRHRQSCWLLLAGDGPLRRMLEHEVESKGITNVLFAGFLDQREIVNAYIAADLLVLPSRRETWGLAVNEALNFGLPVVVSDKVGCAPDLVRDGWNGLLVPVGDGDALTEALDRLVRDRSVRETFGQRGRELVARYGVDACADGIIEAVRAAVTHGTSKEGCL